MRASHMLFSTLPGLGLSWYDFLLTQDQIFRYFVGKIFSNSPLTKHHFCFLILCLSWPFFLQIMYPVSNLRPFFLLPELLEKMFDDDHVDLEFWKSGKFLMLFLNTIVHGESEQCNFLLCVFNILHGSSIKPFQVSFATISTSVRQTLRFSLKTLQYFLVRTLGIKQSKEINQVSH